MNSGGGGDHFRTRQLEVERDELLMLVNELTIQRDSFLATIREMDGQRSDLTRNIGVMSEQREDLTRNIEELGRQRESFIATIAEVDRQRALLIKHYEGAVREKQAAAEQRDNLIKQLATAEPAGPGAPKGKKPAVASSDPGRDSYLNLMERVLTGTVYGDPSIQVHGQKGFNAGDRLRGIDWPATAYSMVGQARMHNFRVIVEKAVTGKVPGDIVETGVWRGGASIMAKAVLDAYGETKRRVFLADSFEGLPPPNVEAFPADKGSTYHEYPQLAVSEEQVKENFRRLGLLDDRVITVKGWFRDTMPAFPVERIAVLRLDGDMYESTIDPLSALYDRVSKKGWIIIDDYEWIPACKQAVHDFLDERKLKPDIQHIDGVGVFFQKP